MHTLRDKSYWPNRSRKKSINRIFAIYHSGTASKIQEHVLSSLKDPESSVRIVIATTALGMGVDIKGLHWVINYGPRNNMESYVQAFVRAGRESKNSEALFWFHGQQLRLCEPETLDFIKYDTFRRKKCWNSLMITALYQTTYAMMYVPRGPFLESPVTYRAR